MCVRTTLIIIGCILLCVLIPPIGTSPAAAAPDPYSSESLKAKHYRGVTLNVVSLEKPVLGEPVELHARQFETLTGEKINITFVPFNARYQEVLQGLRRDKYNVLFYGSMWIADVLPYLALTGREIPQAALDTVAERWGQLTRRIGVDKQREAYRHIVRFEDGEGVAP